MSDPGRCHETEKWLTPDSVVLSMLLQLELQMKDMEDQEDTEGMEGIIFRLIVLVKNG